MHNAETSVGLPPINTAVFRSGEDIILVRLEAVDAERLVSNAVAGGYTYLGSIGLNGGKPLVQFDDAPGAGALMVRAGSIFAGWLGAHLKTYQLQRGEDHGN